MYQVIAVLCLSLCLVTGTQQESSTESQFFSDLKRAVEIEMVDNVTTNCFIHGDRKYITELIKNPDVPVVILNSGEMDLYLQRCDELNKHTTATQHHENIKRKKRFVIYPGTKWCGKGNVANHSEELGEEVETDKCCRDHDRCGGVHIGPLETKYNLTNWAIWYKKDCLCDDTFHSCLKNVKTETADSVGYIFFNVLGIECIHHTNITRCIDRSWFGYCYEYQTVEGMDFRDAAPY